MTTLRLLPCPYFSLLLFSISTARGKSKCYYRRPANLTIAVKKKKISKDKKNDYEMYNRPKVTTREGRYQAVEKQALSRCRPCLRAIKSTGPVSFFFLSFKGSLTFKSPRLVLPPCFSLLSAVTSHLKGVTLVPASTEHHNPCNQSEVLPPRLLLPQGIVSCFADFFFLSFSLSRISVTVSLSGKVMHLSIGLN